MAEATLDTNQQALAPTRAEWLLGQPLHNDKHHRCGFGKRRRPYGRYRNGTGPLAFLNNPDVQRVLPYHWHHRASYLCPFYLWVSAPIYRSVYPGMSEADRREANALDAAGLRRA